MNDAGSIEYSINACSNCRRIHKKCDRKLPQCSLCVKHKKQCTYDTIVKRGPKSKLEYLQPYPVFTVQKKTVSHTLHESRNKILENLPKPALNAQTLGFSSIDMDRLLRAALYAEREMAGEDPIEENFNTEDLALVYAMEAVDLQASGQEERANILYNKSKRLIMELFDVVLQSPIVATCFMYLGTYAFFVGDMDRTTFFLVTVKSYLEKHSTNMTKHTEYLAIRVNNFQQIMQDGIDLHKAIKIMILHRHTLNEFMKQELKRNKNLSTSKVLSVWLDSSIGDHDIEKIRDDIAKNTNSYDLNEDRISQIISGLSQLIERSSGILPEDELQIKRYQVLCIIQGLNLQQYMKNGNWDLIRQTADTIAYLTTLPAYSTNYAVIGCIVILAANAHLEVLNRVRNINIISTVLNSIQHEYNALLLIKQKNKIIGSQNKVIETIHKLELELRKSQENVLVRNMLFSDKRPHPIQTFNFVNTNNAHYSPDDRYSLTLLSEEQEQDEFLHFDAIDRFFQDFIE
jgi:hypothetical protein